MKLFATMAALLLGGLLGTSLLGDLLQYRADAPHPVDLRYSPGSEAITDPDGWPTRRAVPGSPRQELPILTWNDES
jgi:hypothetical protein